MKTRFSTLDLIAVLHDIKCFCGLRVQNVYDIDSKTYLIKLQGPDQKAMLMFESGMRLHPTDFDWPKSNFPSSFSMKLRKHIKQKRLEKVEQLGVDRIVDLQFGCGEWACHVIIEMYDRGNVILTDHTYTILNILRPRTDKDSDVRYAVREIYPRDQARQTSPLMSLENVVNILNSGKIGDNLRRALVPQTLYGPALLEHVFRVTDIPVNAQIGKQITVDDAPKLVSTLALAESIMQVVKSQPCPGFLQVRREQRPEQLLTNNTQNTSNTPVNIDDVIESYEEYHPYLFEQMKHENNSEKYKIKEMPTFGYAVDEFYSMKESQKIDLKALQQQKEALKKLDNVKKDHLKRITNLKDSQEKDAGRAELIHVNEQLVNRAILVIRSAIANQMTWTAVHELVQEGKANGDPTACAIESLDLDTNHIKLKLSDPYEDEESESDEENEQQHNETHKSQIVHIDLAMNPHQNARKYFVHKKQAFAKEKKTIAASEKAVKNAEQKTQKTLKDVQVRTTVNKHRKPLWFEKFFWFISSDKYLVVGGRDAQQNELVVKKYLTAGDAYVHADLRGATSVVVKNRPQQDVTQIPPRTLNEAGLMAVAYSAAWEAKVIAGAWWVAHHQVSKTAPSGEYLTSGSFMIRGKKNYMASVQMQMGFGFVFRMDDESIENHIKMQQLKAQELDVEVEETGVQNEIENEEGDLEIEVEKSEDEDESAFPDVQIVNKRNSESVEDQDYTIIQIGPSNAPQKSKAQRLAEDERRAEEKARIAKEILQLEKQPAIGAIKRRERNKLKKIKEKYADQDLEDKVMRMQLLKADGPDRKGEKGKKGKKKLLKNLALANANANCNSTQPKIAQQICVVGEKEGESNVKQQQIVQHNVQEDIHESGENENLDENNTEIGEEMKENGQENEEGEEQVEVLDDALQVLDSLTPAPYADDILVFAVPVCAPYSAMANFKYRVKLTPGTGKKGKATKTAMQVFLKDKCGSQRERDLLNAAMDQQDIARNLPGKVKVSAPQLLNRKKK